MNNSENKFCRFLSDLMFCVVLLYTLRQIRLFYLKMTKVEKFVKMCLHVKQSKSPFNFTIFKQKFRRLQFQKFEILPQCVL